MSSTVSIACKLRHGLILELGYESTANGMTIFRGPNYKCVKILGTNSTRIGDTRLLVNEAETIPAITQGVDEEFALEWFKRNAPLEYVKRGLIVIVGEKPAEEKAAVRDLTSAKIGFEPVNPDVMPAGMRKGEITPAQNT